MSEAIYIVEYASIPAGIDMLDQIVKRTSVFIIYAKSICIGKFLIVLGGDVDDVREAQAAVTAAEEKRLLQQYLLTNAHGQILSYFKRAPECKESTSGATAIGILETLDAANGFRSLDLALKGGNVRLERVWLGHFIGGKFCYILTGQVGDIKTALAAAENGLEEKRVVDSRIIPSPDRKVLEHLLRHMDNQ